MEKRIDRFDSIARTAHQHVILQENKFTASHLQSREFARPMQVANNPLAWFLSFVSYSPSESGAVVGALSGLLWDGSTWVVGSRGETGMEGTGMGSQRGEYA